MVSWRDSVPATVVDEVDALFGAAMELAEHMLAERGEFFPVGLRTPPGGELEIVSADPGLGEWPPSTEVLAALRRVQVAGRDEVRAVALVFDVALAGGGDAVCVQVEHRDGVVLEVVVPYVRRRFRRGVRFEEMSVSDLESWVWQD